MYMCSYSHVSLLGTFIWTWWSLTPALCLAFVPCTYIIVSSVVGIPLDVTSELALYTIGLLVTVLFLFHSVHVDDTSCGVNEKVYTFILLLPRTVCTHHGCIIENNVCKILTFTLKNYITCSTSHVELCSHIVTRLKYFGIRQSVSTCSACVHLYTTPFLHANTRTPLSTHTCILWEHLAWVVSALMTCEYTPTEGFVIAT